MISKKTKLCAGLAAIMLTAALVGCGGESKKAAPAADSNIEGKITAQGSTALLPLLKSAQEQFEAKHSKVTINLTGGGSFTGMNQVANKAVDIGNSDVELPKELQGKGLVDNKVIVLPFVLIVNPNVTVSNLSQKQANDIFNGNITNWKEVGGNDQKITIIGRAASSGSRATIAAKVLNGGDFAKNAVVLDSNGAVKTGVATTAGAIGYVDAPYADQSVKVLDYNNVKYSPENIINGKYPIWSYGHMYTNGAPSGATKAFIDFVTSKAFQETNAGKLGFIPVTSMPK